MKTGESDRAWKRFGETDPYFAVKGGDELRTANLDDKSVGAFFASGQAHIDRIFDHIRKHLDSSFAPESALDFGCGVGRMLIPLSATCKRVIGVDVSEGMLREAQEKCDEQGLNDIELVLGDDRLSGVTGKFDFVHSNIVFQHIPERRGLEIFTRLIDLLNVGGIGTIHITYFRNASQFRKLVNGVRISVPLANNFVNLMRGDPVGQPMMQMNCYDLNRLFLILKQKDCVRFFVSNLEPAYGYYRIMLYFQKG